MDFGLQDRRWLNCSECQHLSSHYFAAVSELHKLSSATMEVIKRAEPGELLRERRRELRELHEKYAEKKSEIETIRNALVLHRSASHASPQIDDSDAMSPPAP
jgi:hypothetical protein